MVKRKSMVRHPDNASLYGSPDGYPKVIDHYDKTMDDMGIPYESKYIETRFGLTRFTVCGNEKGKPVVLWHGQNANATTWARWIPALAQDHFLYAVDTIGGMGKSAAKRLSRKGSTYGEWAAEVVKALDLHQVNMIGASNGGWLILKLGNVAPEIIENAILLSSAGSHRVIYNEGDPNWPGDAAG
jgi:pimeloyl-ACP methyl ester carboxylesterase